LVEDLQKGIGCSCKVVMAGYRLTPRYPYPCVLEDCFPVYRWIAEHTQELSIDPGRIALHGNSVGGGLSAGLTHLVRDSPKQMPLFQMLIYPVLDARLSTDSMQKYVDILIWNAKLNAKMSKLHLQGKRIHTLHHMR
jgi:acetyl esterase/lipase